MQRSRFGVALFEVFPRSAFYVAGAIAAVFWIVGMSGCSSSKPQIAPTPQHPVLVCAIECPGSSKLIDPETNESDNGFNFRIQHLCRAGKRWFRSAWAIGTSGSSFELCDSPPGPPAYACHSGFLYPTRDVELGSCSSVIGKIVSDRSIESRGIHPGEDEQGRPKPPQR